jgi:hypothetical protein
MSLSVFALVALLAPVAALASREYVPVGAFGGRGTGPGQFKDPQGVAVNDALAGAAAGDVYVFDGQDERVERFDAAGAFEGQFNGSETPAGTFSSPQEIQGDGQIAVDDSGKTTLEDPSVEDVYVVDEGHDVIDRFSALGKYEGQLTGECPSPGVCAPGEVIPFHKLQGVAVDNDGDVWVYDRLQDDGGHVEEFGPTGSFITSFTDNPSAELGIAVDARHDVFVGVGYSALKLGPHGEELGDVTQFRSSGGVLALAVDPATNGVLVDGQTQIESYGAFGEPLGTPLQTFSIEQLHISTGIAVSGLTETVYAGTGEEFGYANRDEVEIYEVQQFPDVSTHEAQVTAAAVTLHGSVDPEGETITECQFEYGREAGEYTSSVPCTPGTPFSSAEAVPVSAQLTGLEPLAVYHFRLTARAAHAKSSTDSKFFTSTAPQVEGEVAFGLTSTSATIGARVNPGGLSTDYRVEYGTSTAYGSVTPEVDAGASAQADSVRVALAGLQPSTVYHARVVAENAFGTATGGDLTFTTSTGSAPASSTLPDDRVYEEVSQRDTGDGEVYIPQTGLELETTRAILTKEPMRAAADGDAVAYVAEPPPTGGSGSIGSGGGNVFVAHRGTHGWEPVDVMPPVANREAVEGFSPNLATAFVATPEVSLSESAPPNCEVLYSESTSSKGYAPMFTSTETPGFCGEPKFEATSEDGSSVLFESTARLTPEALEGEHFISGVHTYNLYDSVAGHVHLVNVLPNGSTTADAALGGVSPEGEEQEPGLLPYYKAGYHHVGQAVSADGSRIVWTDLSTGDLYVRENPAAPDASTVLVAEGAYYRGASSDGSKVLYTKDGDLYEYDVETGVTRDLAPGGSVLGVLGASEDVSRVYFVAESGDLASNANGLGQRAQAGQPNLYLEDDGETRFIATLSFEDNYFEGLEGAANGLPVVGDWRAGLAVRSAEVTPDGESVVFMSRRSITGYDNNGGCWSRYGGFGEQAHVVDACPEVFVFDAGSQQLSCASCNPTGAPPVGVPLSPEYPEQVRIGGAFLPLPTTLEDTSAYQLRTISDDGDRVFFDTTDPLVPQDTNGVQDVYEWERDGSGTCSQPDGCVYLLSGGTSNEESFFVDASASGDDVFFTTRARLVPEDENEFVDLYDARVDGGFPKLSTACTGTGCQGVPPAPPAFATPASVTFAGIGNFATQKPSAKPTGKSLTRGQKLAKALKLCRRKPPGRRAMCERQARKRYAPAPKARSKSKSRRGGK